MSKKRAENVCQNVLRSCENETLLSGKFSQMAQKISLS